MGAAAAAGAHDLGVTRIDIFDSIAAAAPAWDRLAACAIATPFGRRDWIELWQQHIGAHERVRPLIAVARDARDEPLFLLPLACRTGRACSRSRISSAAATRSSTWACGVPMSRRRSRPPISRARFETIAQRCGVDLFLLLNQPAAWDGRRNALAALAHQPSPDDVFSIDFAGESGEQMIKSRLKPALRGLLKSKEKKLAKLDGYRYFRAATTDEAERLLAAFLAQKATHLKAQGVRNAFAAPGVADFLRAACVDPLAAGDPVIELHAIEGGGEVLAVMGGVASPQRFSCMFNSYTLTEHARWSPGLILIAHMLRHCADRGIASYDLGAGFAPYKRYFCKTTEPLFDSVLASRSAATSRPRCAGSGLPASA